MSDFQPMIPEEVQEQMFRCAKDAGESAGFHLLSVVHAGPEVAFTWTDHGFPEEKKFRRIVNYLYEIKDSRFPDRIVADIFQLCHEEMIGAIA